GDTPSVGFPGPASKCTPVARDRKRDVAGEGAGERPPTCGGSGRGASGPAVILVPLSLAFIPGAVVRNVVVLVGVPVGVVTLGIAGLIAFATWRIGGNGLVFAVKSASERLTCASHSSRGGSR